MACRYSSVSSIITNNNDDAVVSLAVNINKDDANDQHTR